MVLVGPSLYESKKESKGFPVLFSSVKEKGEKSKPYIETYDATDGNFNFIDLSANKKLQPNGALPILMADDEVMLGASITFAKDAAYGMSIALNWAALCKGVKERVTSSPNKKPKFQANWWGQI